MAHIKRGAVGVTCTLHDVELLDLTPGVSTHYEIVCDCCSRTVAFTGCRQCDDFVRRCANCGRDFCFDCGSSVKNGERNSGSARCWDCQ